MTSTTNLSESTALDTIERDEDLWPRKRLVPGRVAEFRQLYRDGGANALPPVTIARTDDGRLVLVDGWHRVAAADELDWKALPAILSQSTGDWDIFAEAIQTAACSSAPLTLADKRRIAEEFLREFGKGVTDARVAAVVGLSENTVRKLRRQVNGVQGGSAGGTGSGPGPRESAARGMFRAFDTLWQTRGILSKVGNDERGMREVSAALAAAAARDPAKGRAKLEQMRSVCNAALRELPPMQVRVATAQTKQRKIAGA